MGSGNRRMVAVGRLRGRDGSGVVVTPADERVWSAGSGRAAGLRLVREDVTATPPLTTAARSGPVPAPRAAAAVQPAAVADGLVRIRVDGDAADVAELVGRVGAACELLSVSEPYPSGQDAGLVRVYVTARIVPPPAPEAVAS